MDDARFEHLLAFLTTAHLDPGGSADLAAVPTYARAAWRKILQQAVTLDIVGSRLLLAQFAHLPPSSRLPDRLPDLDLPTGVDQRGCRAILLASATLAAFVQRTKSSFFARCAVSPREKGVVVIVSRGDRPRDTAASWPSNLDVYHIELDGTVPGAAFQDELVLEPTPIEDTQLDLLGFEDVLRQYQAMPSPRALPRVTVRGLRGTPADLFGTTDNARQEYFRHLGPLVALGDVVLCSPLLFTRAATSANADTTGGCLFLVEGQVRPDAIHGLYLIARRICSAVWMLTHHAQKLIREARATAAYNVGHQLSRRLGPASNALDEVLAHMHEQLAPVDLEQLSYASELVQQSWRVADLMHFLAHLASRDRESLPDRFYDTAPWDVSERLRICTDIVNKLRSSLPESTTLVPEPVSWHALAGVTIAGFLTGERRFFSTLYEECIFEGLLNASKKGPWPTGAIAFNVAPCADDADHAALIISNACRNKPLLIPSDVYREWGSDAHEGGLGFLARTLRECRAGRILVRQRQQGGQWWFDLRIELQGLRPPAQDTGSAL